jgi:hypothetical protein
MKEETRQVVMIEVAKLSNHPVADQVPMVQEEHYEAVAMRASIAEHGIQTPLHCDTKGRVFEGRHRLRAAKKLKLLEVPCIVESDDVAATRALYTAMARRQFSHGQRAIVIMSLQPRSEEERRARRLANLKKGSKPPQIPDAHRAHGKDGLADTLVAIAEKYGVSRDMLTRAERLLTSASPKAPKLIARVMNGDIELGAATAGLAGGMATEGKRKPQHDYHRLFLNNFRSFARFSKGYGKIEDTHDRHEVIEAAEALPAILPEELRKALARGLKRVKAQEGGR